MCIIGQSQAILLVAEATAKSIETISDTIKRQGKDGQSAIALSVAEKYIGAFKELAKQSTTVLLPSNVGDMSAMISSALKVYDTIKHDQTHDHKIEKK